MLLLLALGLDSALILTRALGHGPDLPPPARRTPRRCCPRVSVNPALQLATIVNAHLFGTGAAGQRRLGCAATSMPLILAGVIADPGSRPRAWPSSARMRPPENCMRSARAIPGGVHLHAVYADRVLLERNGGLETLMLPRTPMTARERRPVSPAAAPRAQAAAAVTLPRCWPGWCACNRCSTRASCRAIGSSRAANHGTSAFTQLGLKAGDLIEAVNGTPLDDAARAMEVLQTLASSATATVTVSRNGAPQEVNLNLASLNLDADSGDNAPAVQVTVPSAEQGASPPAAAAAPGPPRLPLRI